MHGEVQFCELLSQNRKNLGRKTSCSFFKMCPSGRERLLLPTQWVLYQRMREAHAHDTFFLFHCERCSQNFFSGDSKESPLIWHFLFFWNEFNWKQIRTTREVLETFLVEQEKTQVQVPEKMRWPGFGKPGFSEVADLGFSKPRSRFLRPGID